MNNIQNIPKYSEICNKITGEHVKIASLLDVPIIIWRFQVKTSIYRKEDNDPNKEYMQFQFSYESDPDRKYVSGTSSYYLIADLREIESSLPVRTVISNKQLPRRTPEERIRYAYVLT